MKTFTEDEVKKAIDINVKDAVAKRDAEWRRAFHSDIITDEGCEIFGPHGPHEVQDFLKEDMKKA